MTNFVYIATSLDNFIATSEGGLDWLDEIPKSEGNDFGYAEFMSSIDALVMGRKTFEKVASFEVWPYDKPVFVLGRSKISVPVELEDKIEIVNETPQILVNNLKARGYQNLYIDGGFTIQSFLVEDLIDEMIITRVPILLGKGVPLFGELRHRLYFKHKKTRILNEMLVQSHYIRIMN